MKISKKRNSYCSNSVELLKQIVIKAPLNELNLQQDSTTYFEESVQKNLIAFILQFLKHWSIWGEYFLQCIHNTGKNSKSNSKQLCFYKGVFKAGNKDCEKKTQIIFLQKHFTVLNISILTRYIIIGAGNQELVANLTFLAKWQLTSTTNRLMLLDFSNKQ